MKYDQEFCQWVRLLTEILGPPHKINKSSVAWYSYKPEEKVRIESAVWYFVISDIHIDRQLIFRFDVSKSLIGINTYGDLILENKDESLDGKPLEEVLDIAKRFAKELNNALH